MKQTISIIGAGSWGTTLAIVLSKKGLAVELYSVFESHSLKMQSQRENRLFLKGAKFPRGLTINPCLKSTLDNEIIILAVPVKFIPSVIIKIRKTKVNLKSKTFVSLSKGIESRSLKRASQLIKSGLAPSKIAVISGPNIAREVLAGQPSAAILACSDKKTGKKLQALFTTKAFRIYLHDDLVGVELGGALKNVIAIACGICQGLGFGTNTKAALMTRGLAEIMRLGKRMGAVPSTFWGMSGFGDLVTTCFSPLSRNRSIGEAIGKGRKLKIIVNEMAMVAEGIETAKSAYKLGRRLGVDMPITGEVYNVLYRGKRPKKAVSALMARPLREEKLR